jgi:hypothetical protein
LVKALVGFENAARTGVKLDEAFDGLRAADIELSTITKLETEIDEQITEACLTKSFDAGTPVLMADGSHRPISEVGVGDLVAATDPDTGRSVAGLVSKVYRTHDTDLTDVVVADASGGTDVIHTTSRHLFFSDTEHQWVEAARLTPGTALHDAHGATVAVAEVRTIPGAQDMYDLTVDGVHTFYVLADGATVLVHNVTCARIKIDDDLYQYPDGSIRNGLGHFAGTDGTRVGAVAEKAVMDDLAAQGKKVIRSQVAVRANGQLRYYDCAIDLGNGKLIGVEVKSGTASLTPEQRAFDDWIKAGNTAGTVGRYAGQYDVVDVMLINVP